MKNQKRKMTALGLLVITVLASGCRTVSSGTGITMKTLVIPDTISIAEHVQAELRNRMAPAEETDGSAVSATKESSSMEKDKSTEESPVHEEVYTACDETVYATKDVNVRNGAGTEYEVIGALGTGDAVTRKGLGDMGWSLVDYNGKDAYIRSSCLSVEKPAVTPEAGPVAQGTYTGFVTGEDGTDPDVISLTETYWNMVPENVRNNFSANGWHVTVSGQKLSTRYGYSVSIAGITDTEVSTIYIDNRRSAAKRAVIHEAGHYVDYMCGWISCSQEFCDIFEREKGSFVSSTSVGDGHEFSNSQEYFASVFDEAVQNPGNCMTLAPESYSYVMECVSRL